MGTVFISRLGIALAATASLFGCGSSDQSNGPSGSSGAHATGGAGESGSLAGGSSDVGGRAGSSGPSAGTGSTGANAGMSGASASSSGGATGGAGGDAGSSAGGPLPPALTWTFEPTSSSTCYGFWGSGPNDIYAVGASGTILHSTGDGTWQRQNAETGAILTGVWGSGPTDIYVSVNSNFMLHSDGSGKWEHQPIDPGYTFRDVWGAGANDVYAVVGNGVMHNDGSGTWKTMGSATGAPVGKALWGSSGTDLYLVTAFANSDTVFRSMGDGKWTAQKNGPTLSTSDIWGTAADHIYVSAGNFVFFLRGDGSFTPELTLTKDTVNAVWATGDGAAYACTSKGLVYRSNGAGTWSEPESIDPALDISCLSIWGTDPTNLYVGTATGIYHGTP